MSGLTLENIIKKATVFHDIGDSSSLVEKYTKLSKLKGGYDLILVIDLDEKLIVYHDIFDSSDGSLVSEEIVELVGGSIIEITSHNGVLRIVF